MLPIKGGVAFFVLHPNHKSVNETLNLIYVLLTALGVLITLIGFIIALYRSLDKNASRIDSLEKTCEEIKIKEAQDIKDLKEKQIEQTKANESIRILIEHKNETVLSEVKKSEGMILGLTKTVTEINTKFQLLLDGRIKFMKDE
jgi:hypothetical protein